MSLAPLSLVAGCKCWGAESLNDRFFRPTSSACSIFSCTCRIMIIPKIFGSTTPYNHQPRGGFEHCSLHFRKKKVMINNDLLLCGISITNRGDAKNIHKSCDGGSYRSSQGLQRCHGDLGIHHDLRNPPICWHPKTTTSSDLSDSDHPILWSNAIEPVP